MYLRYHINKIIKSTAGWDAAVHNPTQSTVLGCQTAGTPACVQIKEGDSPYVFIQQPRTWPAQAEFEGFG